MIDALLTGFPAETRLKCLAVAISQAGASMKLPSPTDATQAAAFKRLTGAVLQQADGFTDKQSLLADLVPLLLESEHANSEFADISTRCLSDYARLMKEHLDSNGENALEPNLKAYILTSIHRKLVPAITLYDSRIRMRYAIRNELCKQDAVSSLAGTNRRVVRIVKYVVHVVSSTIRANARQSDEVMCLFDPEINMLPQSPPWRALAFGLIWVAVGEESRTMAMERFRREYSTLSPDSHVRSNESDATSSVPRSDRYTLLTSLISMGGAEVALNWAFASQDSGPRVDLESVASTCDERTLQELVDKLSLVASGDAKQSDDFRHFALKVADSRAISGTAAAALAPVIARILRPGDRPPKFVLTSSITGQSLDASDRLYIRVLELLWSGRAEETVAEPCKWPWLELWTRFHHYRVFEDAKIWTEWSHGERSRAMVDWVLLRLREGGVSSPLEMEIVDRLLRCIVGGQNFDVTEALAAACVSAEDSPIDLAALLIWGCNRHLKIGEDVTVLPLPIQNTLDFIAAESLRKVNEYFQRPSRGMSQHACAILSKAISSSIAKRDFTASSRRRLLPTISALLGHPAAKQSPSHDKPPPSQGSGEVSNPRMS
ncbi:MAG: hypothetical protein JNL18_18620 [Planctomycetaceae bacterium]|nr:hypothetical protein [Planctomycetaceae bacterium]